MSLDDEEARLDSGAAASEGWMGLLAYHAGLEYARVVYGLSDCKGGRSDTMVASDVLWAQAHGAVLTAERAEQRARAYLPVAGHEHCPRCWVFAGTKSLLGFRPSREAASGVADCPRCGAQYADIHAV